MMINKEFKIGQKAVISYNISSIRTIVVECRILKAEFDRIYLDFPEAQRDEAQYFFEGQEIKVTIYTNRGIRDFDSIVIYSPLEGDFVVEYYEDVPIIQRRNYVRSDIITSVTIYRNNKSKDIIRTKTIDIGGGGIRFQLAKDFIKGEMCEFSLYLPRYHNPVKGHGEIIKVVRQENSYDFAVIEFREIREMDRNRIIRVCFEAEAREAKKQL